MLSLPLNTFVSYKLINVILQYKGVVTSLHKHVAIVFVSLHCVA